MGWIRLVGSLKLHVSFGEYRLFYRALLQKRPIILKRLLIVATPYLRYVSSCACKTYRMCVHTYTGIDIFVNMYIHHRIEQENIVLGMQYHIHTLMYTYLCTCVYAHIRLCIYTHVCIHPIISSKRIRYSTYSTMNRYTCIHMYICVCIYIYVYIYTHPDT